MKNLTYQKTYKIITSFEEIKILSSESKDTRKHSWHVLFSLYTYTFQITGGKYFNDVITFHPDSMSDLVIGLIKHIPTTLEKLPVQLRFLVTSLGSNDPEDLLNTLEFMKTEYKNFSNIELLPAPSLEDIKYKHQVSLHKLKIQLIMGIKVELEHTPDKAIAEKIALHHLMEVPDYYTKLKTIES